MAEYTISFINNSTDTRSFLCYQKDPDIGVPNAVSLAWFAKTTRPNTHVDFSWKINYSFIWSETGLLKPGVRFVASERVDADLLNENDIIFNQDNGAYGFINLSGTGKEGSLAIHTSTGFPPNKASIGIGMSGSGTFAVQARPNDNVVFTPHPEYWVAFGNFMPGQVLDISQISNTARVKFPPNVYAMTVIIDDSFEWKVIPTSEANALFLSGKYSQTELLTI
ncbi:RhiA [Aeromonas popoffii]|uniref:RhiA n=1 Tax=Aeromonas popoffii TaxID=70856 RepID=A0ABS5GP87_9GAMM|nr:RhiA [Aeromonas popoffii]MBR7628940.1 RhiA [Aeromonas popoffii]